MYRKEFIPIMPVNNVFRITDICGTWKSICGSTGLKIYHDGSQFLLMFSYKQDTVFTFPLYRNREITFFDFYGMIRIYYDDERDLLQLTIEGEYKRVYE